MFLHVRDRYETAASANWSSLIFNFFGMLKNCFSNPLCCAIVSDGTLPLSVC